MTSRRDNGRSKGHKFGGTWTNRKLDVLAGYLHSYTTALKDKPTAERPFRKAFIDAFAGTGYRDVRRDEESDSSQGPLRIVRQTRIWPSWAGIGGRRNHRGLREGRRDAETIDAG